jgi:hypothetical protein
VFSSWLKSLGGMAIDRSSSRGVVGEMVNTLQQHKKDNRYFWVGLSPEGTRKRTEGWKSGFYQLALKSKLPLGVVRLDYKKKELKFEGFIQLTGDVETDYAYLRKMYEGVEGFHIDKAAPIRPLPAKELNTKAAQ